MDSDQQFMRRRFSKLFAIYMYINLYRTKSPWGRPYITPEHFTLHTLESPGLKVASFQISIH